MLTVPEIVRSVYGVFRLARLDPIGMEWLDRSVDGFWRSFRVAILVLPLEIATYAILLAQVGPLAPIGRILAVGAIGYAIAWTVFPVLSHPLIVALGQAARYPGYIVALNWSRVVIYAVVIPLSLVAYESPPGFAFILQMLFYVGWGTYHWFIARTALGVPTAPAIGLTLLEMVLIFITDHVALTMMTVAPAAA